MPDNRVKTDDIYTVIDTDCPVPVVQGYIEDANLELNERINAANVGYSNGRMAKLEKYLTAHMVRFLWDRQETESQVTNVSASYSGVFGESLTATSPGQVFLDTDTADVFDPEVSSGTDGRFVTRDKYVREVSPSGDRTAESAEKRL